ncbi:MAG: hypothetical protein E5W28_09830, partial [Mesorhizobium sp.]
MQLRLAAAAFFAIMLYAGAAGAEDPKAFKLTIDGVTVDIDPGEDMDVKLPSGKTSKVRLEHNDFATFSGGTFSFVHPSNYSVT